MNRKTIIILAAVLVALLVAGGAYLLLAGDTVGTEPEPAPEFTPPPLSDDPPMSGDNIDAIMRQMEEKDQ